MSISIEHKKILEDIVTHEITLRYSRGSGKGGQNRNKLETKAELYFNITSSSYLTTEQKERLMLLAKEEGHYKGGKIIMTDEEERYQIANRKKVINKFKRLLQEALIEPEIRINANIPKKLKAKKIKENEKRLTRKKIHSSIKKNRTKAIDKDQL